MINLYYAVNKLKKVPNKIYRMLRFSLIKKLFEHEYDNGGKYILIKNKNSRDLLVVFSGFTGDKAKYNYIFSLNKLKINKLFILDDWGGYKGSYYLMVNGTHLPESNTRAIIEKVINELNIDRWYTAGSSKGGSAELYFGLKMHASSIYSAACQFRIGTYLYRAEHRKIFDSMKGSLEDEVVVDFLDNVIEERFKDYSGEDIHLYYSDSELTFERQIVPMKEVMNRYKIPYSETVEHFERHEDVGLYFPAFLLKEVSEKTDGKDK